MLAYEKVGRVDACQSAFSWYRYTTFISAWICETFQARDLHFVAVIEGASTSTRQHRRLAPSIGGPERNNTFSARKGLWTACYDLNIPRSSKGKLVGFGRILVILDGKTSLFHGFPSFFPDINSVKQPGFTPCHEISLPIHQAEMQRSVRRECNICSRECGQVWGLELGVANFIHPGSCKLRLSRKLGSTAWLESGPDLHTRNKSSQMTKDYNQFPFFSVVFWWTTE